MVIDSDLHKGESYDAAKKPLDVDRFFSSVVVEPCKPPRAEGTLTPGRESGSVYLTNYKVYVAETSPKGDYLYLVMRESQDAGRTWSEPWKILDRQGELIQGFHQTVVRMKSGKLGLVYNDTKGMLENDKKLFPGGIPGRDLESGMMFRESSDEGRTWSDPVVVHPFHAMCCAGHAIVLESGRILAPAYTWISHHDTVASEATDNFCYSWVVMSDDEGKTWRCSYSQIFINRGHINHSAGEPTVVELTDGRLLMDVRTVLGRRYFCHSENQGMTWSKTRATDVGSGSTPTMIRRMPTGELLMVWTQVSWIESIRGYHRHRLSCAISKDEGRTWEKFKNLESLDNETAIKPPPADRFDSIEAPPEAYSYHQPSDTDRYHRAPGVLRICYPDVLFVGDEAVIVYDYGFGTLGKGHSGVKLRVIPVDYLRS